MSVKNYVDERLMMKEMSEEMEQSKVRFSVTVAPDISRRLEYCAKKLDTSRSGLANDLIERALFEVEEALGFKIEIDGKVTDYGKEIYGTEKKAEVS